MTRTSLAVVLILMLTGVQTLAQYQVHFEPNTAKRRAVSIDPGPCFSTLRLYSDLPWRITESHISLLADDGLWVGPEGGDTEHTYRMARSGQSSLKFVQIEGHLCQHGPGDAPLPVNKILTDTYRMGAAAYPTTFTPSLNDPAEGEPVQHATQYYRAGSTTIGVGILVKQHTTQFCRGYARQL